MKKAKFIMAAVLMLALTLGMSGVVHALPCTLGFVNDGGDPDYFCQDGAGGSSNDSISIFNDGAGYFGINDWVYLQKKGTPGALETGAFDVGLVVTPDTGTDSGTWSFSNSPWGTYANIMLAVKDGRIDMPPAGEGDEDIWYSAYLVGSGDMSGDWDTGGKDISHMTVYGSPIPEPGTLLLFGSGIAGLFYVRRKKVFNM